MDGEFTVVYPPTMFESFVESLNESKDIAIALLYVDYHDPNTKHAQTELSVLKGWRKPHGELVKVIRYASSCGDPEALEEGEWYVVVYKPYNDPALMKFKLVEGYVNKLGPSTYAYSTIGLLPK